MRGAGQEVAPFVPTGSERARHAELSSIQASWLDFVAERPAALSRSSFRDLDEHLDLSPERVQPWPLFADASCLAPIEEASRAVMGLVATVPQRIFGGDPDRMADFYGCGAEIARRAMELIDGGCLPHLVSRADFLRGAEGFQCCEVNAAGNLGGWQVGPWAERFARSPLIAEFLVREGLALSGTDPIQELFHHAAAVGIERGLASGGELNLALVTSPGRKLLPSLVAEARSRWRRTAEGAGVPDGRFFVCTERELLEEGGRVTLYGDRVHLFIDQAMELLDGPMHRSQAAGGAFGFNGWVSPVLSDKRNLALLSEQAEGGDLYDAAERAKIARFIPWTRLLLADFSERAGERIYLPDFVLAERERLVIKPAGSFGGEGVSVGAGLEPSEWVSRVDAALADGRFLVQDFVASAEYLFQSPDGGAVPHEMVWGSFLFGARFGSCLLRGAPRGAGVVNVTRGARRIVLLEVEHRVRESGRAAMPTRPQEIPDVS